MLKLSNYIFTVVALGCAANSAAYERVISLAPHITELIYEIGAEDRLIATVNSSNYPPAALNLPKVGDGVSVSAESVLALKPDVVFAWQPTRALMAIEDTLEQSGIALHYIHPQSLTDIADAALQLGDWLQQPARAQALHTDWLHRLQRLKQTHQSHTKKTVFIALNAAPLYTLNDPIINEVLSLCGVQNWAQNSVNVAPAVNIEQLLATPVDGIIYSKLDPNLERLFQLLSHSTQQTVGRYEIDPDKFYRSGPRLFDATEQLCELMEPKQQK